MFIQNRYLNILKCLNNTAWRFTENGAYTNESLQLFLLQYLQVLSSPPSSPLADLPLRQNKGYFHA